VIRAFLVAWIAGHAGKKESGPRTVRHLARLIHWGRQRVKLRRFADGKNYQVKTIV
jgi:hypothetical protein